MPRHHSNGDGLAVGSSFSLPDGRTGRVTRCRRCGAEIVVATVPRDPTRRAPYDLDGVSHGRTCADRDDAGGPRQHRWAAE